MLLACSVLALGVLASLAGALTWRSSVREQQRQAFQSTATDISARLQTLVRADADFAGTLRTVLSLNPDLRASDFSRWFNRLEGHQRQVGALGTLIVSAVPASQLTSFERRRNRDHAFRTLVGGHVAPVVAERRSRYCLLSAGGVNTPYSPAATVLLQGDWCDPRSPIGSYPTYGTMQADVTASITDSARTVVYPVRAGTSSFFIDAPFYRSGVSLSSVAARRAAVLGWVLSSFDVNALIRSAVGGHRELHVALYHENSGRPRDLIGNGGAAKGARLFSRTETRQFDGTWIVKVSGSGVSTGLSAQAQALLILLGGGTVSVLLTVLLLTLTRSRRRALGMVQEKTGELRHQALHDSLTGLANRVLVLDRAEQMLARARRDQHPVAALYIDIDGFKDVNDTYGHAAGDELLQIVASRLRSVVRESDTAARLGGDEFVVLVEGSTLDAGPDLIAERVLAVLCQPYDLSTAVGRRLTLTVSIGIAFGLRETVDELLRDADLALYEAKAAGRNRYRLFESAMQTAVQDRLAIQMDLAVALEQGQFFLQYQPTFDLRTERMVGVEALIRWRHPTRGIISPDQFIPRAEESGMVVPIGLWVLQEACEKAAGWHRAGHRIRVAVNVSGRQLDSDQLIEDVRRVLGASGLEARYLTLEVTETALMQDPEATARRLRALKKLGLLIAIDDFGTGYSSLAYLRRFPVDSLKIDRSFITDIAASKQSTALVNTLVQLGNTLHIETLAEGIEDEAQLRTLQREHCDQGQGFLFSRPLDLEDFESFLEAVDADAPLVTSG
jgi:diguanylate cyclase (GGDEF)-like protein